MGVPPAVAVGAEQMTEFVGTAAWATGKPSMAILYSAATRRFGAGIDTAGVERKTDDERKEVFI
ncbi:hypothetical protein C9I57_12210 [Trinickia symbiotica]|uniref:Uncharacterized protein n=1 Tax=Trinickia symbiotica TaxID=863227 RepID=A0A2T3XVR5_9BURK|nr:hypothetical protein C9I57_12210 [Trinickia symbiotica]